MEFTNEQIHTKDLPSIQQVEFKGLHKDYLTVELIWSSILLIILIVVVTITMGWNVWQLASWMRILAVIGALVLAVGVIWLTIVAFQRKKYALRQRDIIYQSGLIWRSLTAVPFNRIQHAQGQQGHIERLFHLSKLNIYTAGGSSSDLSISGLWADEAHRIKEFILKEVSHDEEE